MHTRQPTELRLFSAADQDRFAALSGDYNPMHMDAVAARRMLFGKPVVHGVHLLLWLLDLAIAAGVGKHRLTTLDAAFDRPVLVGDAVESEADPAHGEAAVSNGGEDAMRVRYAFTEDSWPAHRQSRDGMARDDMILSCRDLASDDIADRTGSLTLDLVPASLEAMFPRLATHLCPTQTAILLAVSRLVGMECPGRHSILKSIRLRFADTGSSGAEGMRLHYRVARFARMVGLIDLEVRGPNVEGTVQAFLRPPPVEQAPFAQLARLVDGREFVGRTVLVVGGSRGLGEVTAKLLAAGGAMVWITGRAGIEDARNVAAEIRAGGGLAEAGFLDVGAANPLAHLGDASLPLFSHLCYFATPPIRPRLSGSFDFPTFSALSEVYVEGFDRLVRSLVQSQGGPLSIFYPSTAFLDSPAPGFAEYVAAKAAGEALCRSLERELAGTHVTIHRLPRLKSDQTVSLLPSSAAAPEQPLLAALREMPNS